MSRDRTTDNGKEPPATAAEEARAEAIAELVDRILTGEALPPAMDFEDRSLVEAATMIVASSRSMELPEDRTSSIIDQALVRSMNRDEGGAVRPLSASDLPTVESLDAARAVATERPRRRQLPAVVPWSIAAVAAAAAIVLFLTRPERPISDPTALAPAPPAVLEPSLTSRPSDALIGPIPRPDSGHASERLDAIYADRLAGYRALAFHSALGGER